MVACLVVACLVAMGLGVVRLRVVRLGRVDAAMLALAVVGLGAGPDTRGRVVIAGLRGTALATRVLASGPSTGLGTRGQAATLAVTALGARARVAMARLRVTDPDMRVRVALPAAAGLGTRDR